MCSLRYQNLRRKSCEWSEIILDDNSPLIHPSRASLTVVLGHQDVKACTFLNLFKKWVKLIAISCWSAFIITLDRGKKVLTHVKFTISFTAKLPWKKWAFYNKTRQQNLQMWGSKCMSSTIPDFLIMSDCKASTFTLIFSPDSCWCVSGDGTQDGEVGMSWHFFQ